MNVKDKNGFHYSGYVWYKKYKQELLIKENSGFDPISALVARIYDYVKEKLRNSDAESRTTA